MNDLSQIADQMSRIATQIGDLPSAIEAERLAEWLEHEADIEDPLAWASVGDLVRQMAASPQMAQFGDVIDELERIRTVLVATAYQIALATEEVR